MKFRFRPRRTASMAAILLVVLALAGVAAGVLVDHVRGPQWTSSTNVLVQDSTGSMLALLVTGQAVPVSAEDIADAAVLAVSQSVLTQTAQALNDGESWTDLAGRVTATPVPASHLLTIEATAPNREAALQTSELVASTLTNVAQQQLSFAATNLPTTAATPADSELLSRGRLVTRSLQPMQAFATDAPTQVLPSIQTPAALGIVGLAAGALIILLLTIRNPTVRRPRDVQRLVERPAVAFAGSDGGLEASRLLRGLLDGRPRGPILICPVDLYAEQDALTVADWTRQSISATPPPRVVLMAAPAAGASGKRLRPGDSVPRVLVSEVPAVAVLSRRPTTADVAGLLLVVPQGTPRRVVTDAVSLLATWRSVDAVIVSR